MKIKLLKRLRNDILQNFEYHDGGWSGYYRVIYKGTRYQSEIVSGLNYFLTGGYWFIRKVIIEEIKKMREKSDIKFMYIKKDSQMIKGGIEVERLKKKRI